jgi:hypothetical protein
MSSSQKPLDGYGKWNFAENGPNETYDGQWKNGLMHGKGVYRFQGGAIYDGEFVNNKQHGKGTMVCENGDTYVGDWKSGLRHGRGKTTFTNGSTYEGEFSCGMMHGVATCIYTTDGRPSDPDLDYSWSAGDKMVCEIKKGVRHGECTYTFFNGETFSCTWVDGRCPAFSARQRLVLAHPDEASMEARAAGHTSIAEYEEFKIQAADAVVLTYAKNAMVETIIRTMVPFLLFCFVRCICFVLDSCIACCVLTLLPPRCRVTDLTPILDL